MSDEPLPQLSDSFYQAEDGGTCISYRIDEIPA